MFIRVPNAVDFDQVVKICFAGKFEALSRAEIPQAVMKLRFLEANVPVKGRRGEGGLALHTDHDLVLGVNSNPKQFHFLVLNGFWPERHLSGRQDMTTDDHFLARLITSVRCVTVRLVERGPNTPMGTSCTAWTVIRWGFN